MAYKHLSICEREFIQTQLGLDASLRSIGKALNRCHTSISRELRRNNMSRKTYNAEKASGHAELRRLLPNHRKKRGNTSLVDIVVSWLKGGYAPDVISGLLKRFLPDTESMHVSHETIYRWVYNDFLDHGYLYKYLPKQNNRRKPHCKYSSFQGAPKDRVSIKDRPKEVYQREEGGHWEGDLIVGCKSSGYFITLLERKSRFLLTAKIETKDAKTVCSEIAKLFLTVPKEMLKTLTFDNGKEFYDFKSIEEKHPLKVYFADPYCSGQRGSNENANGLIRRAFPKKHSFANVTNRDLQKVTDEINLRPRKILGYHSATSVFLGL